MSTMRIIFGIFLFSILSGCVQSTGDESSLVDYNCGIPCLATAPTASATTISSATGGHVDLEFTIQGNLTDVASVYIEYGRVTDGFSAGYAVLTSPTTASNTVRIYVDSGVEPGTYYPVFDFYTVTNPDAHGQYNVDDRESSTKYMYAQALSYRNYTFALTPFDIPYLTITP